MQGRRHERGKALVAILTAIFLLSSLAQVLINQEQRARDDLVQRFQSRGQTGAQLISAYIHDIAAQEADFASKRLADAEPDPAAFESLVESFGFEAAVLVGAQGNLLQVYPHRPDILGQNLADEYDHIARALKGETTVSNVVPSAAQGAPILAVAVPFDTPGGRRVFSGAFGIGSSPLDEFTRNVLPFDAKVYMVDSSSQIVASTVAVPAPFTPLGRQDPALYSSLRFDSGDTYVADGETHIVTFQRVPGISWTLIMSVPERQLLRPLDRLRWVPWLVYAGLAAASTTAVVLLIRLWQRQEQLRNERRRLEEQLEEAVRLNTALDEFAGRVAHDLRNPLGNALAATQMAARHSTDGRMLDKWLNTAQGQLRRGIDLIQGLLDLAKTAGTPKREPVDLNELVDSLSREIKDIEVKADPLPLIEADKLAVRQALANLMENAGRYARNNGVAKVTIKAQLEQVAWVITVEDQGPGLTADEVASVFRPFHRGRSHSIPGTGLGLAIVATAAKAHGGHAWYEPRPGGGSMFKFSLSRGTSGQPLPGEKRILESAAFPLADGQGRRP